MKKHLARLPKFLLKRRCFKAALVFQCFLKKIIGKPASMRFYYYLKLIHRLNNFHYPDNSSPNCDSNYTIYVIHNSRDSARLSAFQKQTRHFRNSFKTLDAYNAIDPGFDFSPHLNLIGDTFCGYENFPRGNIGCFLSHHKAWQSFHESNDQIAVVFEDDALVLGELPQNATDFHLPDDADIVLGNNSICEGLFNADDFGKSSAQRFEYVELSIALLKLLNNGIKIDGPGAYGYIITKKGVEKLLEIYRQYRYLIDHDWFIIFCGLDDSERNEFIMSEGSGRFQKFDFNAGRLLNVYVSCPPFAEHGEFPSSRGMKDRDTYINIKTMRQAAEN